MGAERRVAGAQSVMDGLLAAFPDAIHAGNTTAQVDAVRFRVDTRRFAVACAQAAAVAFFFVYVYNSSNHFLPPKGFFLTFIA